MRIKNRKTNIEYILTNEQWQKLKDDQRSFMFAVVDQYDNGTNVNAMNIPDIINEFRIKRPERIVTTPVYEIEKTDVSQVVEQGKTTTTIPKKKPIKK